MKKLLLAVLSLLFVAGFSVFVFHSDKAFGQCSPNSVERAGCCSHHGGVCGCNSYLGKLRCCDGTTSPSCGC